MPDCATGSRFVVTLIDWAMSANDLAQSIAVRTADVTRHPLASAARAL